VAVEGEVTCNVVEPLVPGASVSMFDPKLLFHPEGSEAVRLKLPALQRELSLFRTETV
jgi:hypothetical protein